MELVRQIEDAFAHRQKPRDVVPRKYPGTDEYADAGHFEGKEWKAVDLNLIMRNQDAIYAFTPQAFLYYLPAFLTVPVLENRPELLTNQAIVTMLDRSPNTEFWDQFFVDRFSVLTDQELSALEGWILWLTDSGSGYFSDESLSQSLPTIDLLRKGSWLVRHT